MIVGNAQAQAMVAQFFRAVQEGKTVFPFLLVTGRPHVGKTMIVEEQIQQLLGTYFSSDYVALYDLHERLGKDHPIKIEAARGEEYVTIDETTYCQRGIREVTHWLSRAPLGKWKVIYLENIERMTTAAANALLKSFEEPLPGRLLIASATSPDRLLDTIRSRALLIPFYLAAREEIIASLQTKYPTISSAVQQFVLAFSLGARGVVEQLLVGEERDQWVEMYTAIVDRCVHPTRIHDQMSRLQRVAERGQLEQLLDALLYAGVGSSDLLVRVKKYLQSNVGQDNILFWRCSEVLRGG